MPDATIYPTFRFHDAGRMIAWLEQAFGFQVREKHMAGDRVGHCELALGDAVIMCGDVRDDFFGALVGSPGAQGGKAVYVAIDDVDALHVRAVSAGAAIEQGLTDRDYGSREFICRDPEGNVWCFGTYRPQ